MALRTVNLTILSILVRAYAAHTHSHQLTMDSIVLLAGGVIVSERESVIFV